MTRPTPPRVIPPTRRDLATVNRHRRVRPALGRVVAATVQRRAEWLRALARATRGRA